MKIRYFECGLVDYEMTQVVSKDKNTDCNACIFTGTVEGDLASLTCEYEVLESFKMSGTTSTATK
jgi:hypothetical protein